MRLGNIGTFTARVELLEPSASRPRSRRCRFLFRGQLDALAERKIRAYLATGRAKHPEAGTPSAAGRSSRPCAPRSSAAGHRSRYRLRKQIVEPVFGQIKQARRFRQFVLRGIENVRSEWALICIAHNLVKLVTA
jgi:hypothetical protein